ncbi:hypothetical protein CLF_103678, partial [Clonorchis sinensis]
RSVFNPPEENAAFAGKELDTPGAAINTDGGDQSGTTNKENMPISSGQETETESRATPATRTEPNQSNNDDLSHSAGPSAGSPAGETVGSEKRQYSSDRPASARIDWDRIDWESLDASSNPFSLSSNVQKSETSEKMEQSSGGQAELVTKPVENSATEEAESLLTKTESRVKATGGILTKISIDTEHEKSGQGCGIQNVSSAEHFDQSLAEKDKVKIDSELVLEGEDNIDPLGSKVVNAEPKTLNYEANTVENEKRSDLENMAAIGTTIPHTDIHTVPVEDKEHKNADYPNENPACREPEDASTSGTTNTTEQRSEFSPPLPRGDWKNSDEFSDTSGGKVTKSLPKDSEDMPSPGTDGAEDQGGKYSNEKTGKTSQRKTNSKTDNKDPSTQKPETETENVNDTASRADERKSLDQTALSPPLPGGEYEIDFDNLDEYSDPFGGKITNKMAKPSAPKSNDPGKESKDQHTDKTSGPSEMGNAPKARKMQEKSENPTLENPVQEKSNAGSTNDAEKSEEQTVVSPPLPRGEYKLDFDNLDEYSDPFGGKVTNTMTRPSVSKPKDGGEETKSPREDKSSKPTKVESAPKGKAKQPKTNNRKSESPMQEEITTTSTTDDKKTEEQTELSPPLPRGEYKLDFDNLDEYSDPFGGKLTNTNAKPSVPKSKDVDEEMKSPRDDHSSKSTKVEDALKGKAKQPNTNLVYKGSVENDFALSPRRTVLTSTSLPFEHSCICPDAIIPTRVYSVQVNSIMPSNFQFYVVHVNTLKKSEEQIELSPPLPRGEYKIDFDNLDEYSDPFGGKVTNTTKKSSVVKSKEVGDEMETQRGDKSSKSAKVEGAPKGKQPKQPNTKKEDDRSNAGSVNMNKIHISQNPTTKSVQLDGDARQHLQQTLVPAITRNKTFTTLLIKEKEAVSRPKKDETIVILPVYKGSLAVITNIVRARLNDTIAYRCTEKYKAENLQEAQKELEKSKRSSKYHKKKHWNMRASNSVSLASTGYGKSYPEEQLDKRCSEKNSRRISWKSMRLQEACIPINQSHERTLNTLRNLYKLRQKSEEQIALSPPLPRGEYKLDFDNLDEYSDPFGGKVTNTMTRPSVSKPKDGGEETNSPRDDKSSKSTKVESAPKGKAKQPKTKTPSQPSVVLKSNITVGLVDIGKRVHKSDYHLEPANTFMLDWFATQRERRPKNSKTESESAVQEKSKTTSTIGVEKSEEQTVVSPPLPRGEYKLDFDNLDEYSDPFGGKVTSTMTRPSVSKPKDGGEETNSPRDDKSSKSTKVESAPKGKAKQPNTTNRTPEVLAANKTGSSPKERLEFTSLLYIVLRRRLPGKANFVLRNLSKFSDGEIMDVVVGHGQFFCRPSRAQN